MRGGSVRARALALALVACTILVPAAPAYASRSSDLASTRREIAATRHKLSAVLQSDAAVLAILNRVNDRLDGQRALLYRAQTRLTQLDLAMRVAGKKLQNLGAQLAARRELIGERARTLYILGPAQSLEAIAGAETVDQFVSRAGELDALSNYDTRIIEEVTSLSNETKLTRQLLAAQRAEAAGIRNEIAERVSAIAGYASIQQQAHNRLAGRISDLRAELAAEKAEQARILDLIRSRGSVYTGRASKLGFAWPLRGPITSPYGPRNGGFHTGIDIGCFNKTPPIGASKAGRVIEAGWGGGYGNMVIIDHGNGYATLYAHMSRIYVSDGARVTQHQKIGLCGSTGNSTGNHLHFEVRVNGNHVNPRPYLP